MSLEVAAQKFREYAAIGSAASSLEDSTLDGAKVCVSAALHYNIFCPQKTLEGIQGRRMGWDTCSDLGPGMRQQPQAASMQSALQHARACRIHLFSPRLPVEICTCAVSKDDTGGRPAKQEAGCAKGEHGESSIGGLAGLDFVSCLRVCTTTKIKHTHTCMHSYHQCPMLLQVDVIFMRVAKICKRINFGQFLEALTMVAEAKASVPHMPILSNSCYSSWCMSCACHRSARGLVCMVLVFVCLRSPASVLLTCHHKLYSSDVQGISQEELLKRLEKADSTKAMAKTEYTRFHDDKSTVSRLACILSLRFLAHRLAMLRCKT